MAQDTQTRASEQQRAAVRWIGRVIGFLTSAFLLMSFGSETASGYSPSGSVTYAALSITLFGAALVATVISVWWDWLGGAVLVAVGLIMTVGLLLGVAPQANILPTIIVTAGPFLLAGCLLLLARKRTRPVHA